VADPFAVVAAELVHDQRSGLIAQAPVDHLHDHFQIIQQQGRGTGSDGPLHHQLPHGQGQGTGRLQEMDEPQALGSQSVLLRAGVDAPTGRSGRHGQLGC
jgi:hypothetical protein